MRVPTPNVSLVELVFVQKKIINIKKINDAFEQASKNKLKNILEITHEKLVSIDFNHHPASAIVDASLTNVVGRNMGKISAWYDNEWGFSNRMCDIAETFHKILMRSIINEKNLNNKNIIKTRFKCSFKKANITDTTRIDKILPTLNFLIKENAKIIILSHVGRPKGKIVKELSLEPIRKELQNKLKKKKTYY